MTQKQLIDQFCEFRGKCTTDDVVALNFAYKMLMKPQWISVEDELPKGESEYDEFSEIVLATDGKDVYESRYHIDYNTWYTRNMFVFDDITHWMPLPEVPHHFADVSQKVKKGGKDDIQP